MAHSSLMHLWRIEFACGVIIECYRERKPTRLADSWAKEELLDGSTYGAYAITCLGLFNKGILDLASQQRRTIGLPSQEVRS